jgi:hypothetical protein
MDSNASPHFWVRIGKGDFIADANEFPAQLADAFPVTDTEVLCHAHSPFFLARADSRASLLINLY